MEGQVEGEAQGVDDQKKISQFVTVVIFVTMYNSFFAKIECVPDCHLQLQRSIDCRLHSNKCCINYGSIGDRNTDKILFGWSGVDFMNQFGPKFTGKKFKGNFVHIF
jgi:hypothetical protein